MKTILVVREFDVFSRILAADGFEIINIPLIETKVSGNLSEFESKLAQVKNYHGIFVTSARAAQILADSLRGKNTNFSGKVYILGKRSFEILQNSNLDLVFDEAANTAREMLAMIPLAELKNKRFLFVCGEKSLRIVPNYLEKIASVEESIVYRTQEIAVEIDKTNEISGKFKTGEIAATCFFSPSAVESFIKQFGTQILHQTLITTIGKTTAEFLKTQNVQVGFVSSKANAEDFAFELAEYLERNFNHRCSQINTD